MPISGNISSIVYQTEHSEDKDPFQFNRIPSQEVELVAGHGIKGDRKAGHNPNRHLNIMSQAHRDALASEGYAAAPGELGEQITVYGFAIEELKPGTLLQFGETAIIRINSHRTGCAWLEKVQGRETKDTAKDRLGVMASVIESGTVRVGDAVRVLETAS